MTRLRSVGTSDPDWRAYKWIVPDTLDGFLLAGNQFMNQVYDYFGTDRGRSDRAFTVPPRGVALRRPIGPTALSASALPGGLLRLDLARAGLMSLSR